MKYLFWKAFNSSLKDHSLKAASIVRSSIINLTSSTVLRREINKTLFVNVFKTFLSPSTSFFPLFLNFIYNLIHSSSNLYGHCEPTPCTKCFNVSTLIGWIYNSFYSEIESLISIVRWISWVSTNLLIFLFWGCIFHWNWQFFDIRQGFQPFLAFSFHSFKNFFIKFHSIQPHLNLQHQIFQ